MGVPVAIRKMGGKFRVEDHGTLLLKLCVTQYSTLNKSRQLHRLLARGGSDEAAAIGTDVAGIAQTDERREAMNWRASIAGTSSMRAGISLRRASSCRRNFCRVSIFSYIRSGSRFANRGGARRSRRCWPMRRKCSAAIRGWIISPTLRTCGCREGPLANRAHWRSLGADPAV